MTKILKATITITSECQEQILFSLKKTYVKIKQLKNKEFEIFTNSVLNPTINYNCKIKKVKKKIKKNKKKLNKLIQSL